MKTNEDKIKSAFICAYGRSPTPKELELIKSILKDKALKQKLTKVMKDKLKCREKKVKLK